MKLMEFDRDLNSGFETGLIGATGFVMVGGTIELEGDARASDHSSQTTFTSLRFRPGLRAFGG